MRRSIVADFITHVAPIFADGKGLSLRPLTLRETVFCFPAAAMTLSNRSYYDAETRDLTLSDLRHLRVLKS